MKFDLNYLEKLANMVYENDLSELTLEDEVKTISFRREKQQQFVPSMPIPANMAASVSSHVITPEKPEVKNTQKEESHKGTPVKSPMTGTFYASPSPDDAPFVKPGDSVATGQVVCIIEAMKLMNEIEAETSGKISEICVKNGDSVELGQVLMYIE